MTFKEVLVQVNALGQCPVRGLPEPVEVFELVGASAMRRGLQVSAARGLTRSVGRQQALLALQQALERALLRESQVQALLLVCENVHWIDTETQAVLNTVVEGLPTARLQAAVCPR
jgi:hypothetical protein